MWARLLYTFLICLMVCLEADAAEAFAPGNILVADSRAPALLEYTLDGELVQSIPMPVPEGYEFFSDTLDIVTDNKQRAYVLAEARQTETHEHHMCILSYDSVAQQWHQFFPEELDGSSYAYIGDLDWHGRRLTALTNSSRAHVFDASLQQGEPIPSGNCMTFDAHGNYYVATGQGRRNRHIFAYDGADYSAAPREILIPEPGPSSIAVAADGSIYVTIPSVRKAFHLSPTGEVLAELSHDHWGSTEVYDIDLLPDGRLIFATRFETIYIVDGDFSPDSLRRFEVQSYADKFLGIVLPVASSEPETADQAVESGMDPSDDVAQGLVNGTPDSSEAVADDVAGESSNTILYIVAAGLILFLLGGVAAIILKKK